MLYNARLFGSRKFNSLPIVITVLFCMVVSGCLNHGTHINNACLMLEDNRSWYKGLSKASKKWTVPEHVILAFIYQESKFKANAKPPRKRLFGIIPTVRPSSAYGFAQALDTTWREYKRANNLWLAKRSDFADAADFVGWYIDGSRAKLKIVSDNVVDQYLAYHEGRGGYSRGSYKNKSWLVSVAQKVAATSLKYRQQLDECQAQLKRNRFGIF